MADVEHGWLLNCDRCLNLAVNVVRYFFVRVAVGDGEVCVVESCAGFVVVVAGLDIESNLLLDGYCCFYFFVLVAIGDGDLTCPLSNVSS